MSSVLSIAEQVDKLQKDIKAVVEILRLMLDETIFKHSAVY